MDSSRQRHPRAPRTSWPVLLGLLALAAPLLFAHPARAAVPPVPAYDHVFTIVMENTAYGSIIGNPQAPYINRLAAQGAVAANYHAVDHPSLPNYAALTGGQSFPNAGSDCAPSPSCQSTAANIGDRLEAAGKSWKSYSESMPAPCTQYDAYPYVVRHNPFVYYADVTGNPARCAAHDVPYADLGLDLNSPATTPAYAFISPNACSDMHDCSTATGDAWLQSNVPAILSSPAFTSQRSLLVITWDEDDWSSANQVAWLAVGSGVRAGFRSAANYDHYSFLHTVEAALNLAPLTANDAGAPVMADLFDSADPLPGRPYTGGHDVVGAPAGSADWYFAEGYTGQGFQEYLTVLDLSGADQVLVVEYLPSDGSPQMVVRHPLRAGSRLTVDVNSDVGAGRSVAAHLHTDSGSAIVAERPMYFNFAGRTGGHDALGVTAPGQTYYFAEGYTGAGFDEYLTLANFGSMAASATVTFEFNGGATLQRTVAVPALARATVYVNGVVGAGQEVSMRVDADQPIVAERPMYFNFLGWTGGHVSSGTGGPASSLDLAEGCVDRWVQEYLTLFNPGPVSTIASLAFLDQNGRTTPYLQPVPAHSRVSLRVNDVLPAGTSNSVHIESPEPLVVERPMYFDYLGKWDGGHLAVAQPSAALGRAYYFAEGFVGGWADEYLTIENPGASVAHVHLALHDATGGVTASDLSIGPRTRATVKVNDLLPPGTEVATVLTSDQPVLAERPMYFSY